MKRSDLADLDTPISRNEWYIAALASEVTRAPLRRMVAEQDIVFFRDSGGRAVALQNRCAHRSYPLSEGRVEGDTIVCGYHGMAFGADGRCVHIPSQRHVPSTMCVQSYPVVEQGPWLWVWTGDPALAQGPSDGGPPAQPWFTDTGWAHVTGYIPLAASYLRLHENLLDLSHFAFVHGAAFGRAEHAEEVPQIDLSRGYVHSVVVHRDIAVSPAFAAAVPLQRPVSRTSEQWAPTPAIHVGKAVYRDSADPPRVSTRYIMHYPTPETRTSTHYFWGIARDHALDDAAMQAESLAIGEKAFNEDRTVLEAIEALVARDRRPDFRERIIATDRGGVEFLRWLKARVDAREGARTL